MRSGSPSTTARGETGRLAGLPPFMPCMAMVVALSCLLGRASISGAESGTIHQGTGVGLRMDVDTRWLSGAGCRPARITVTPLVPAVADRTLTVEFSITDFSRRRQEDLRVVQDIEIPAGSTVVESTMSIPQTATWSGYTVTVLEDGQVVPRLSSSWSDNQGYGWAGCDKFPSMLIVGDELPKTSALAGLLNAFQYYQRWSGRGRSAAGEAALPTAIARPPTELPRRWIEYTNLDLVCLSVEQLAGLAEDEPEAFKAILDWTLAGGNLCVYGVGRGWSRLAELELLLGLPPREGNSADTPATRGWTEPERRLSGQAIRGVGSEVTSPDFLKEALEEASGGVEVVYGEASVRGTVAIEEDEESAEVEEPEQAAEETESRPPLRFVFRQVDLGMVVAVADDDPFADPFPWGATGWSWILNSLESKRFLWYQRHGMSALQGNGDFWNFLIPGVGLAPIMGFRILITLFVLFIGPVNYFLLRRWKSLHLLVVTVPLSAAAVTVALFAYAMVADGLGMRIRVRSFTQIDQRRGHAVCWARLSYYAGLAPVGGLRFPSDTVVLPMRYLPDEQGTRTRELIWGEEQWLSRGWLPPRTPTQMITVRSRHSSLGLTITETEDAPGELSARNRLGVPIRKLIVRSKDGKYFRAADLETDGTVEAEPTELADVQAWLEETFRECEPVFPAGMDRRGRGGPYGWRMSRYRWHWAFDRADVPPASQKTGLLETALATVRTGTLEPGSYLAIVDRSPEVVVGVSSAREEASLHVIRGTW